MGSVYGRLGYDFDTIKFNGADVLSNGANNYLTYSNIQLSSWQTTELGDATVGGYYQNPHTGILSDLTITLNNIKANSNTDSIIFTYAADGANILSALATSTIGSIVSFKTHTDNISGVTLSSNTTLYPDLNSAMGVSTQILTITNKTDSVQNNVPILGNFTSLYIGPDLITSNTVIANDNITLLDTIYLDLDGNNASNITNSAMNVIISDVQTLKTLIDTRKNGDISFYVNSLAISNDYQTLLQFSNIGATQNSLIQLIGTDKLKNNLYS